MPPLPAIRRQLLRQLLVGLFLVLGGCGVGVYLLLRGLLVSAFDQSLEAKARVLTALIEERRTGGYRLEEEANLPEFAAGPAAEYFSIVVEGFGAVARSNSLGGGDLPALDPRAPTALFADIKLPDGRPGRAVALRAPVPIEHPERAPPRPPAWAHVRVARERGSLDAGIARVFAILALAGSLLFAGVPLVVRRVVRQGLRPLDRLADQTARIDATALDVRFPVSGIPEELLPICTRLNDLLARLAGSFERERRFSADVAHELRTPLAELRATAEVALRYPDAPAGPAFQDVLAATVQMEHLVETLFTLSRCESGRQPVALERVELGRCVRDAWTPLAAAALAKGLTVTEPASSLPPLAVMADRALLGAIVHNLFSNAIEYAPRGGQIAWTLQAERGAAALTLTNTNTTLAPEHVAQVFDPFWRRDSARTGGVHSGLGLSLSRAFARLQAGDIDLDLPRPDLVRVSLRLPLAEEPAALPPRQVAAAG